MSNPNTTDYTSEEYAKHCESTRIFWLNNFSKSEKEYRVLIDRCLELGIKEGHNNLATLFTTPSFTEIFCSRSDFAYMAQIVQIYIEENKNNIPHTILDTSKSLEELLSVFYELKFILWRIKNLDGSALELLQNYIDRHNASPIFIKGGAKIALSNDTDTLVQLIDFFTGREMYEYAYYILQYLNEYIPNDPSVTGMLRQLGTLLGKE